MRICIGYTQKCDLGIINSLIRISRSFYSPSCFTFLHNIVSILENTNMSTKRNAIIVVVVVTYLTVLVHYKVMVYVNMPPVVVCRSLENICFLQRPQLKSLCAGWRTSQFVVDLAPSLRPVCLSPPAKTVFRGRQRSM